VTEGLQAAGFWSYVHADDDAERGRISQLAREVMAQYRLNTASELDLFLLARSSPNSHRQHSGQKMWSSWPRERLTAARARGRV